MDWVRGKYSARKILNLIDLMPDPSVFYAQVAANAPPVEGSAPEPEKWRRWYGWGTDRMLAHAAVGVHLDEKGKARWQEILPGADRATMSLADAMDFGTRG